ncbi:MAG: aspartate--tRNA ligase [Candidatus Moranbacteria bacterium]|nr:aspartate--tRNA ligase [Candidatus Moranbacteria bacterium]
MERVLIQDVSQYVGQRVKIMGWVNVRRDQGKLIFLDFRDATAIVQGVILPGSDAMEMGKLLREEFVVAVEGNINERPERNRKEGVVNGSVELEILGIEILNTADVLPFPIDNTEDVNELARLKYRYLDLRSDRMQKNIRKRHEVLRFVRKFFDQERFIEVETPYLTKSTPEGSRDYIVPSRLDKGKFYALPQSPQQYKQLLMTAGMERYFQIARCFRDEDTRGDRQPEFTQIDVEMSFATQEEIMQINEELMIKMVAEVYPEKRIQQVPFPRLSYKEAMEKYGNDKPDIREDKNDPNLLAFCWVVDFPFFEKTDADEWTFTHNPFSAPVPGDIEKLINKQDVENIVAAQYDMALNGYEIGGGGIRNHKPETLKAVFEIMGYSKERIEANFHHMLQAFSLGTPPHGGIAFGFDRLMMILQNEPNIREVIPFAKTGEGRDPMMESPSEVDEKQLGELGIKLK